MGKRAFNRFLRVLLRVVPRTGWFGPRLFLVFALSPPRALAQPVYRYYADVPGDFFPTSTTLTVNPTNATPGSPVILIAQVTEADWAASTLLSLYVDGSLIGAAAASSAPQAQTTNLLIGPHVFRAESVYRTRDVEVTRTHTYANDGVTIIRVDIFYDCYHDTADASSGNNLFTVLNGTALISSLTNHFAPVGTDVTLVVTPTTPPIFDLWLFEGVNIVGETNAMLLLTNVHIASHSGNYAVMAWDGSGLVTSSAAALTVSSPPVFTAQPQCQTANAA